MDIKRLKQEVEKDEIGVDVPILSRDKEPYVASDGTPTVFTVLGQDSQAVQRIMDKHSRVYQRLRRPLKPDELLKHRVDLAVAATIGWKGVESEGKPIAFSSEIAREIYETDRSILSQVEEAISDHARFFAKAS